MKRIQIVTIQPEGYLHSRCFEELSELLGYTFQDLGYQVSRTINRLHPHDRNLILGYHLLPDVTVLGETQFLIYQLEHLEALPIEIQARALSILKKAVSVWDYSEENRAWLLQRGVPSHLVLPGSHSRMQKIQLEETKEVDLLFYGTVTPRREKMIHKISSKVPRFKIIDGLYGEERDQWIGRSNAVVNLHAYDRPLYEAVRISYLLDNRVPIISETSLSPAFKRLPSLVFDLDHLDCIQEWIQDQVRLREIGESDSLRFQKEYSMKSILEQNGF